MAARGLLFLFGLVVGAIAIGGGLGRWASSTAATSTLNGIDTTGGKVVTIAAAIAVLVLALNWWRPHRWLPLLGALAAAIAGAIAGANLADAHKYESVLGSAVIRTGWGLYLATLGGIVLFVLCVLDVFVSRQLRAAAAAPPGGVRPSR